MERMRVLGMMSGTSLDGVDAAIIETDGHSILTFGPSQFRAYAPAERKILQAALGRWPGDPHVEKAADLVGSTHWDVVTRFDPVDLIGFHGQTLAHDPAQGRTHQAGDGARLSLVTQTSVAWDFRSADMAAGGQGAPLAPAYHYALARWIKAEAPLAFLNLGGVGNITWIDPRQGPDAMLAFDTGPANAPMNDVMLARHGLPFDRDGVAAAEGQINQSIVAEFLDHRYFAEAPPKSLDRDDFSDLSRAIRNLGDADAMATLAAAAAASVGRAMAYCPTPPPRLLVTGGGRRNPVLMGMISDQVACHVAPVEEAGLDGDMLEAQAFAYLAARVKLGLPISFPGTTGVATPQTGGRISLPG